MVNETDYSPASTTSAAASPVLAIDEAHMLDPAQLEAIRMLTNHDIPGLITPEVAVR